MFGLQPVVWSLSASESPGMGLLKPKDAQASLPRDSASIGLGWGPGSPVFRSSQGTLYAARRRTNAHGSRFDTWHSCIHLFIHSFIWLTFYKIDHCPPACYNLRNASLNLLPFLSWADDNISKFAPCSARS